MKTAAHRPVVEQTQLKAAIGLLFDHPETVVEQRYSKQLLVPRERFQEQSADVAVAHQQNGFVRTSKTLLEEIDDFLHDRPAVGRLLGRRVTELEQPLAVPAQSEDVLVGAAEANGVALKQAGGGRGQWDKIMLFVQRAKLPQLGPNFSFLTGFPKIRCNGVAGPPGWADSDEVEVVLFESGRVGGDLVCAFGGERIRIAHISGPLVPRFVLPLVQDIVSGFCVAQEIELQPGLAGGAEGEPQQKDERKPDAGRREQLAGTGQSTSGDRFGASHVFHKFGNGAAA